MEATLTIAFLLPENPPAQLLANLPSSEDGLKILVIEHGQQVPADATISGITWVPPTKPAILEAALDAHPECKWIHAFSAGVDYIAEFIKRRLLNSDVALSNGRGAFSDSLAEYAIAAALHFNKCFKRCEQNRLAKKWDKFVMPTIAGKTMGFVGYGHIGQTTAKLAAPLGLRLIGLRRHPNKRERSAANAPTLAATYGMDDAATFYSQCDFVVCSLPLTDESKEIINADSFEAMKASTVFISLGRGAVVDEAALHKALTTGQIAGAACDVFATEPLPESSPLWECDNL